MTLFDNLLTVFVLLGIAVILYLKSANRTLVDLFRDIREILSETGEEVVEYG